MQMQQERGREASPMKQIQLSQGIVEYRDTGTGPVVLFVHGLLVSGTLWSGVAERLSQTHRCVVPDWPFGSHRIPLEPGTDRTPAGMARLVADFMAALDLREVTLVGNDTGGAISQIVAADHGERLARLALTNCDALEAFPPKGFGHLAVMARIPGAIRLLAKSMLRVPALRRLDLAFGALTKRPIPDETLRAWVEPAARDGRVCADATALMRAIEPSVTLHAAERLVGFRKPVLLLWSREDPYFTLDLAQRLQAKLPGAELCEVPDARTFGALDQPERLAHEIARFAV